MGLAGEQILLRIGGDDSGVRRVLDGVQARLNRFGNHIKAVGAKVAAVGAAASVAAGALSAPLTGAVMAYAKFGDAMDKMSQRVGLPVEALGELDFAAQQSGASLADIESAVSTMSNALGRGTKKTGAMLSAIGLSFKELDGLTTEQQLERIAAALDDVQNQSVKTAAAQALMGGSGKQLLPMLGSLRELRAEARGLGVAMTGDQAKGAAELTDAFGRVTSTVRALVVGIGGALAPAVTAMANRLAGAVAVVRAWVANHQGLILSVGKGVAVFAALAGGLTFAGTALAALGIGLGGIASLVGLLGTAMGAALSPVGLMLAAVTGGAYAFFRFTDAGRELVDFAATEFQALYGAIKPVLDAVIAAFMAGDLELAASVAFGGVKVAALLAWAEIRYIFQTGVAGLADVWGDLATGFGMAWELVRRGCVQGWNYLKKGFLGVAEFVGDAFLAGVETILGLVAKLVDGLLWVMEKLGAIKEETGNIVSDAMGGIAAIRKDNARYYADAQTDIDADVAREAGHSDARVIGMELERRTKSDERFAARDADYDASRQGIAAAQMELAGLVRKANALANAPVAAAKGGDESRLAKAARAPEVNARDIGNTASFNAQIAAMLATTAANSVEAQQLDALERIADNTEDLDDLGHLAE